MDPTPVWSGDRCNLHDDSRNSCPCPPRPLWVAFDPEALGSLELLQDYLDANEIDRWRADTKTLTAAVSGKMYAYVTGGEVGKTSPTPPTSPTNLDDVLQFRKEMYERSAALVRTKGADYARGSADTLFNLRVVELLGIVDTTERGIMVRLMDKMMRLHSLASTRGQSPAVEDESVLDTVADIHNYVDYLAYVWKQR